MTTSEIELPSDRAAVARADFISQSTAVEQARAVAEVQAAIVVAQQCPRNVDSAIRAMRDSCSHMELAERAFYKYPRSDKTVSGESIALARELARCWGNFQWGHQELRRDDRGHYSEMAAYAWDVETNTRGMQTFVVPHKRDKRGGPAEVLIDLRDIYENNANMGARRLRSAITGVLPTWFVEEAKALCLKTLEGGGGKPLEQQITDAIRVFEGIGIKVDRLESKHGPSAGWKSSDVAHLRVSYASIQQQTVTVEDEFPKRVTADEITSKGKASEPAPPRPEAPAP